MGESRIKKGARNASINVIAQIISLLLGFVSRRLFIQFLTVEYLGLNSLFSNVLTMLSLAELGIGEAVGYALYRPMKEDNREKLRSLVRFYRKAYLAIAVVIGIFGFLMSFFLDFLYAEKPDLPENFRVIFLLFVANSVCSYVMGYKQTILVAGQKEYMASILRQVVHVVQAVAQIIVLAAFKSYYLYLIIQIVATVLYNAIVSGLVDREYPFLTEKNAKKLEESEFRRISKDVAALSVSKISGVVMHGTDSILISRIIGVSAAGIASNYAMVISAVNGILWKALISLKPSLGNFNVDATLERKRDLFDEIFLIAYWVYAVISVCLTVLLSPFVELWLGKDYLVDQNIVVALVLTFYIGGVNFPAYVFRTTHGRFEEVKWAYVASGLLNIALSIVWGLKWGVFGIFLASAISRICTSEILEGRVVYEKILCKKTYKYFLRMLGALLLLGLNYTVSEWVVSGIADDSVFHFILKCMVCFLSSNGVVMLLFCRTRAFSMIFLHIKRLFSK